MHPTANETDTRFYQMIHQLIKSQSQSERRGHQRGAFTSTQRIAPLRGDKSPQSEDFFEVRCNDLTPNGFSFFIDGAADFDQLIVAFQSPSGAILIQAEVRHSRRVLWFADTGRVERLDDSAAGGESDQTGENPSAQEKGEPMTLVGCRFTGRFA